MTSSPDPTRPKDSTKSTPIGELMERVPEEFRPIVAEYGPAFLAMTKEQVVAWIILVAKGNTDEAYERVLAALPNQDLLAEWRKTNAKWKQENFSEARRQAVIREAGGAILKVLLSIALALVGL